MKEKILIIACLPERQELYEFILKQEGYATKVLEGKDNTPKLPKWNYTEQMVEVILDFSPKLIVSDLGACMAFATEVLEFLLKIRNSYGKREHPLNLVVLPRDYFPFGYEFLIDGFLPSPIDVEPFLDTIKELFSHTNQ
jgi:hypothetical protein